jgi:hypothetical protein
VLRRECAETALAIFGQAEANDAVIVRIDGALDEPRGAGTIDELDGAVVTQQQM